MQGAIMILTLPNCRAGLLNALGKGQLLALHGRRGARIESRRGAVWVTQDGDLNDVVLNAGESHVLGSDATVLIQALDAACVSVESREPDRAAGSLPSLWRRLRSAAGWRPAVDPVA
jgi:hypothetical protein